MTGNTTDHGWRRSHGRKNIFSCQVIQSMQKIWLLLIIPDTDNSSMSAFFNDIETHHYLTLILTLT